MTITEHEVREMFPPDGVNWEDYWLGTEPERRLQAAGRATGWRGIPDVLADMRAEEIGRWTPELDSAEALLGSSSSAYCLKHSTEQAPGERGGGLKGDTSQLRRIREGMVAYGQQSVDFRRRVAALKR